jgi:hypothetical protein
VLLCRRLRGRAAADQAAVEGGSHDSCGSGSEDLDPDHAATGSAFSPTLPSRSNA